jgi:hypothetical protein
MAERGKLRFDKLAANSVHATEPADGVSALRADAVQH